MSALKKFDYSDHDPQVRVEAAIKDNLFWSSIIGSRLSILARMPIHVRSWASLVQFRVSQLRVPVCAASEGVWVSLAVRLEPAVTASFLSSFIHSHEQKPLIARLGTADPTL